MVLIDTIPAGTFPNDDPITESAPVETTVEEVDTNVVNEVLVTENAQNFSLYCDDFQNLFYGVFRFLYRCHFDSEPFRIMHYFLFVVEFHHVFNGMCVCVLLVF